MGDLHYIDDDGVEKTVVNQSDVDDTPVDGVTTAPISSNWAFDHVAAADPHTGYRLESADHTHQSSGAEAGKLDHGLALDGLSDDDHPQYLLRSIVNGSFKESFDADVTSDGSTVTMSLEQSGTGDLIMQFSDGLTTLDCTPAATIALTAGSDASPQANWIYIPQSTKVLTKSTTAWPSAEHIKIAFFFVQSAASVQTAGGPIINQNWNDHLIGTDNQGHLLHMAEKLRMLGSSYFDGIDGNGTTGYLTITAGNVEFKSTSGNIFQLHKQVFPAFDTSGTDTVHVKNWSGDAYHAITNLHDITADSGGVTITNNKYFNLVIWGVQNKTGEHQTVMINLPSGFYNTQADAENDVSGYDDFTIPREFNIDSSVGFLICRVTLQMGATWSHISAVDLRGTTPQTASGSAGNIVSSFADNVFNVFDESDNTKILAFDVGTNVTTGNTRTLQVPDASGIITLLAATQTLTNKTLTSPTINGTIATTGLTLPAITLGGAITGGGNALSGLGNVQINNGSRLNFTDSGATTRNVLFLHTDNTVYLDNDAAGNFILRTDNASGAGNPTPRLTITGNVATASATWANITHAGLVATSPTINGTIATTGLTIPAFTLAGTLSLNTQTIDAGASSLIVTNTGNVGMTFTATHDGAEGSRISVTHASASPAVNDVILRFMATGRNSVGGAMDYARIDFAIEDPVSTSEDGKLNIQLASAGGWNDALRLSSLGVLDVDASSGLGAATVGQFDDYDDAILLKQGISQKQFELLEEAGIMSRKNSGSGWMLNLQAMCYLLAGGIYQTRARVDALDNRLNSLELALPQGG